MPYFYFWTFWGWYNAGISTILSICAANDPEYWHVMAFSWLELSHCMNLTITPAFWLILMPASASKFPPGFPSTALDYFEIIHMIILHGYPLIMTLINIQITDIKMLKEDWKLQVFCIVVYLFCNALGEFDKGEAVYPMTDWVNSPGIATAFFVLGTPVICGLYTLYCNHQPKRKNE